MIIGIRCHKLWGRKVLVDVFQSNMLFPDIYLEHPMDPPFGEHMPTTIESNLSFSISW
jgi:hypothetical protein